MKCVADRERQRWNDRRNLLRYFPECGRLVDRRDWTTDAACLAGLPRPANAHRRLERRAGLRDSTGRHLIRFEELCRSPRDSGTNGFRRPNRSLTVTLAEKHQRRWIIAAAEAP
jgi:hypothetical protein